MGSNYGYQFTEEELEEYKLNIIGKVQDILYKELEDLKFENGHKVDVLPIEIIERLPYLIDGGKARDRDYRMKYVENQFNNKFIEEHYRYDPYVRAVIYSIAGGISPYKAVQAVLESYVTLKNKYEEMILKGVRRSAILPDENKSL